MSARFGMLSLFACCALSIGAALAGDDVVYPRVFRTFMPEAGPSAFAVELSPEVALCYDPLRGGVNQIWRGSVGLTPTFQAKINQPAKLVGPVFYAERAIHPLRLGDPEAKPEHRFKGYRYEKDAVVFEFTLRGLPVAETLRLSADGRGVAREFALPASGGTAFYHSETQSAAEVTVTGGSEIKPGLWRFPEGGRFTLLIVPNVTDRLKP